MKRILLVDLGKQFGGAEQYVSQIGALLADRYEVHFLVRSSSLLSIKIRELQLGPVVEIAFKGRSLLGNIHRVRKYISQQNIEIVHANGVNSEFFLTLCGIQNQVKLVTTIHGIAEFDRIEKRPVVQKLFAKLQVLSLKRFDRIIAVSHSIKENLIEKKVNSEKITTIYHAIDVNQPLPLYTCHHPLRICYVGRLEKVKNVAFLIQALHNLQNVEDVECDLYGTGSELENLQKLVLEYGLQDRVRFKGYSTNVTKVYRTHDLLVQPSLYEAFGLTVIEAMSSGIPVLCAEVGGMKEIVHHNQNGLLFPLGNPRNLTEQVEKILSGELNLELMRNNAYKEVRERYSTARLFRELCEVYENEEDRAYDQNYHK